MAAGQPRQARPRATSVLPGFQSTRSVSVRGSPLPSDPTTLLPCGLRRPLRCDRYSLRRPWRQPSWCRPFWESNRVLHGHARGRVGRAMSPWGRARPAPPLRIRSTGVSGSRSASLCRRGRNLSRRRRGSASGGMPTACSVGLAVGGAVRQGSPHPSQELRDGESGREPGKWRCPTAAASLHVIGPRS